MLRLRHMLLAFVCLVIAAYASARAQSSAEFENYRHHTVVVRSLVAGNVLQFDARGHLIGGDGHRVPFTLACLYIEHIARHDNTLVITGRRIGLYNAQSHGAAFKSVPLVLAAMFINGTYHVRRPLSERVEISVPDAVDDRAFTPALSRVFASSWQEVAGSLPSIWHALSHRDAHDPFAGIPEADAPHLSPPQITTHVEPELSDEAIAVDSGGTCVVKALVSPEGVPVDLRIVKPVGLGLDERAADAVSRYRFSPALRDGKPVEVAVTIEVKFQPE